MRPRAASLNGHEIIKAIFDLIGATAPELARIMENRRAPEARQQENGRRKERIVSEMQRKHEWMGGWVVRSGSLVIFAARGSVFGHHEVFLATLVDTGCSAVRPASALRFLRQRS